MPFKSTDYLLMPKDLFDGVRHFAGKSTLADLNGLLFLVFFGILFALFLDFTAESIAFLLFIVALLYWDIDSRVSIALGLVSLILVPISIALFDAGTLVIGEVWAEKLAIWAYYFLGIGVIKQIWEFACEKSNISRADSIKAGKKQQLKAKTRTKKRSKSIDIKKRAISPKKKK